MPDSVAEDIYNRYCIPEELSGVVNSQLNCFLASIMDLGESIRIPNLFDIHVCPPLSL